MPPIVIDNAADFLLHPLPVAPSSAVVGVETNGGADRPSIVPIPPKSRALAAARRARQRRKAQTLVRYEELDEKLRFLDDQPE